MTNKRIIPAEYQRLLADIKQRVRSVQYEALKTVNKGLIALYWDIGHMITERQKGVTWGKSVVERLAKDLQGEFPGIHGFSARNIWRMRDFYLTYHANPKLSPMVTEIGWSHNLIILTQCKDPLEREFYIRMIRKFGWTKNVLIHQIENKTYEKTLLNQTNFDKAVPEKIRNQAKLAVKDEYTFDFLELGEEHSERELERAILAKIASFLQEMGGLFTFVGNQYHLEIEDKEFFIDLLLYHRGLKSLVAVELKIGEFVPEFVGKMQFYLTALDRRVRMPGENPSIGIILCKSKSKTFVEYALWQSSRPIGVATYKIVDHLPKPFKGKLPEPAQIIKLLESIKSWA